MTFKIISRSSAILVVLAIIFIVSSGNAVKANPVSFSATSSGFGTGVITGCYTCNNGCRELIPDPGTMKCYTSENGSTVESCSTKGQDYCEPN